MNRIALLVIVFTSALFSIPVRAGETTTMANRNVAQEKPTAMAMPMGLPAPGFRFSGWLEAGITFNPDSPDDNQNFGRLLDDRSNEPLLNQSVLTAERGFDPMTDHFDRAFRTQFLYGTDARYLHTTGLLDLTTNDIVQP